MNVLIVDDQSSARMMMRKVVEELGSGLTIADFDSPLVALDWARDHQADLVLLDYRMPQIDGLQFLTQFRRVPANRDVPIILITVVGDAPVRQAALEAGVTEFLVKPIRPRELLARCKNFLSLRQLTESVKARADALERSVVHEMQTTRQRQRETFLSIAQAMDLRYGAGGHVTRVARFAALIAERLGLPDVQVRNIELAAPLHDLGMIALPDTLLSGNLSMNVEQTLAFNEHTRIGSTLLAHHSDSLLQLAAGIALSHHERWDGAGYPDRLSAKQIPLEARIVGLADSFDDLISVRDECEGACSLEVAVEKVRHEAAAAFDPDCVEALLADPSALIELSRSDVSVISFPCPSTAVKLRA